MSAGSRHLARQSAVQALYQWDLTEQPPSHIEQHFISDHNFAGVDLEYFRHLIRSVPLYHQEIDNHLRRFIERDIAIVDPVEKAILRLGTYELEYERSIPVSVVLDEAVELTKIFGSEHG